MKLKTIKNKENHIEIISILVYLVVLMIMFGPFTADKKLTHDSPVHFQAGDMFLFSAYSEGIKETGNVEVMPEYFVQLDPKEDIVDPIYLLTNVNSITTATLSIASGVETYDVSLFLNLFFAALFIILFYLLLRKVSVPLAIFSVPVMFMIFKFPFNFFITWGMQMSNFNMLLVLINIALLFHIKEKFFIPVFGIILASGVYAHTRETINFGVSLVIYIIFLWFAKDKEFFYKLKRIFYGGLVGILLVIPYLPTLKTINRGKPFALSNLIAPGQVLSATDTARVIFPDMGWWMVLILIGAIFAFLLIKKKKSELFIVLSLSFGFVFGSYVRLIGNKTSQIRHYFPLIFAPFIAIFIYQLYKFLKEKDLFVYIYVLAFSLLMINVYMPDNISPYGISNPETFDIFRQVWANTPLDSDILILYGDNFMQQKLFLYLKRNFQISPIGQVNSIIKNNSLDLTKIPTQYIYSPNYIVKKGTFSFEKIERENELRYFSPCQFDYIYYNYKSYNEQLVGLNQAITAELITKYNFTEFYANDLAVILQRGECNA